MTEVSFRHRFMASVAEFFSKREDAKHHQRPSALQHLVGGTTAGVVTTTALYPLDLVKTRYQARRCCGIGVGSSHSFRVAWSAVWSTSRTRAGLLLSDGVLPRLPKLTFTRTLRPTKVGTNTVVGVPSAPLHADFSQVVGEAR